MPVKGRGIGLKPRKTRTKTGCLSCRMRRKKCDETKPRCLACQRNKLTCSWEGVPSPKLTDSDESVTSPISTTSSSSQELVLSPKSPAFKLELPVTPDATSLLNDNSKILLSHFINVTAMQTIGKRPGDNALLTHILPLAHQDDMLLDAILAYSGAHVSYRTGNPDLKSSATVHYRMATRKLDTCLSVNSDRKTTPWEANLKMLATCVVLYHFENVAGNSSMVGLCHLQAANVFIRSALEHKGENKKDPTFGFLLEWCIYLNIINHSASVEGSPSMTLSIPDFATLESLRQYSTYGSLFGCASELFRIIPDITKASRDRTLTTEKYLELHQRTLSWKPDGLHPTDASWNAELVAAAQVFQAGVECYLHSCYYGRSPEKRIEFFQKARPLVFQLFGAVTRLIDSPLRSTLIWPVMFIGACAETRAFRDGIKMVLWGSAYEMIILERADETLTMAWELQDKDPKIFGAGALAIAVNQNKFGMG